MKRFAIVLIALVAALVFQNVSSADDKMPCGKDKADCKMMDKSGMPCDKMDKMPCKDGMGGGMMCDGSGPGCDKKRCRNKGMDGMMGPRGDVDGMTWPRMNKSCRTPDFYLDNSDALGISDVQAESLGKLDEGLRRDMIIKGAQVKALELDLSNIVTKTDFKYDDAAAKLKEIEKARTELRLTVIKASADARDLLGKEQLDKIKDMGLPGRGCRMMPDGRPDMQDKMDMPGMDGMPEGMMKEKMMENMRERMMQ